MIENTSRVEVLAKMLANTKREIAEMQDKYKAMEMELSDVIRNDVCAQLADKDYGCGTANIAAGAFKIKVEVKKKVSWDNDLLGDIKDALKARGEDADEYVETKYNVSESRYKNWPSSLQALFQPARTVDVSKPTITIEGAE